ncbi:hypothetical protein IAU60_002228 [Kwoniella sp. DSM 27419]
MADPGPSRPPMTRTETFDLALAPSSDTELARVLDRNVQHPQCVSCQTDITSGMKIYLARHDRGFTISAGDTLCKGCYTKDYSLGTCLACQTPIIGEREEGMGGKHITARGNKWHARCFGCSGELPSRLDVPYLFTDGSPACPGCYAASLEEPGLPRSTPKSLSSTLRIERNKYARPGQVIPPQTAEIAAEIRRLSELATVVPKDSAHSRPAPIRTSPSPAHASNGMINTSMSTASPFTQALRPYPANTSFRPSASEPGTSVLDRVRKINSALNEVEPHENGKVYRQVRPRSPIS